MMSQPGKQTIAIHVLPNKANQTVKFSQLIEYNMSKIFCVVEKLFPDSLLKYQN